MLSRCEHVCKTMWMICEYFCGKRGEIWTGLVIPMGGWGHDLAIYVSVRENPHLLEIPMGSWWGPSFRPTVDKNKRLEVTCFIVFSTGHGNEYWDKNEKIIPNQMTLSWRRTPCSRENHSNPHLWRTVMLWHDFKVHQPINCRFRSFWMNLLWRCSLSTIIVGVRTPQRLAWAYPIDGPAPF